MSNHTRHRVRPALEALEDRTVPSTVTPLIPVNPCVTAPAALQGLAVAVNNIPGDPCMTASPAFAVNYCPAPSAAVVPALPARMQALNNFPNNPCHSPVFFGLANLPPPPTMPS